VSTVVIAPDAVQRLAAYRRRHGWADVLVVMDVNTRAAVGARVAAELGCPEFVFRQREGPVAGPDEVAVVRARLRGGVRGVAVGSGVITDIVRYASHLSGGEFISVPTAASMDGYASSMAALALDGLKVTYPARAPAAIFADPAVVAAAPPELTRAGLGDLLGKATARVDWLAAHLLYGEPYDEAAERRVLEPLGRAAIDAPRIMAGQAGAVRSLLAGLVQSGIAMARVGSSRPASGCEHHASHFWDLLAAHGRRAQARHGLQVGYATRFAMRLARFAFGGGITELRRPAPVDDPLGPEAQRWLGRPSPEIAEAVREKAKFVAQPMTREWAVVCTSLAPALAQFGAVESALDVAGIPAGPGFLEIDEPTLRATFRYATRLRARYTTVDFLEGQGRLEEAINFMLS
jgi:glycerol-1-phosphate dehydrogenase [NAD(P)+]